MHVDVLHIVLYCLYHCLLVTQGQYTPTFFRVVSLATGQLYGCPRSPWNNLEDYGEIDHWFHFACNQHKPFNSLGHMVFNQEILWFTVYSYSIVGCMSHIPLPQFLYPFLLDYVTYGLVTGRDVTWHPLWKTRNKHADNWPLTRYAKLRVAHAPGMPETFFPPPWISDPDMHHGTCVTHVPWCMPGSLTSGFLWSRWRGKRSRHSRCMRNPQFCASGKGPMGLCLRRHQWSRGLLSRYRNVHH